MAKRKSPTSKGRKKVGKRKSAKRKSTKRSSKKKSAKRSSKKKSKSKSATRSKSYSKSFITDKGRGFLVQVKGNEVTIWEPSARLTEKYKKLSSDFYSHKLKTIKHAGKVLRSNNKLGVLIQKQKGKPGYIYVADKILSVTINNPITEFITIGRSTGNKASSPEGKSKSYGIDAGVATAKRAYLISYDVSVPATHKLKYLMAKVASGADDITGMRNMRVKVYRESVNPGMRRRSAKRLATPKKSKSKSKSKSKKSVRAKTARSRGERAAKVAAKKAVAKRAKTQGHAASHM